MVFLASFNNLTTQRKFFSIKLRILVIFLQSNYRTRGTFRQLGKQSPSPYFLWVSPGFHKLYVNYHIASPLQIITKQAWPVQMWGGWYMKAEALSPPLYSLKTKSNTFCTICKLFKPVPQCDFIMFTQSNRYTWIGNPIVPHPLSPLFGLYMYDFFQNHFWYVHSAKHTYHGWNPQNICTAKKNYHQEL